MTQPTLLQIDVTGTDADGNVAVLTIEVPVGAAAAPAPGMVTTPAGESVRPATVAGEASFPGVSMAASGKMDIRPEAAPPEAPQARVMEEMPVFADKPVQITGLGNATGHNSAVPVSTPAKATQAVVSTTLFRSTGGFR